MKPSAAFILSDPRSRSCLCSIFVVASLICGTYFISGLFIENEYKERVTRWGLINGLRNDAKSYTNGCKDRCSPPGTESLPQGIIVKTSNLEMQPLWGSTEKSVWDSIPSGSKSSLSLLAIAVGINQKEIVNQIVEKFHLSEFMVMLFHYDGFVDEWRDLEWSDRAVHVSAVNQTKWWFAKRFLHPDIVDEYDYIFLWDEDLGVDHFDARRYLSIVKDEGLEISQPALDPANSTVYHPITIRQKGSRVHRRFYKFKGSGRCDSQSLGPPCVGWVEMMAPVFSRAAWKCAWHMIQNDLIHAWGLDIQLGYCAQGERIKNVGVVDEEYVVHLALPTLGVSNEDKTSSGARKVDNRGKVRMQSHMEMKIFNERWDKAVKEDSCWFDPFQSNTNQTR